MALVIVHGLRGGVGTTSLVANIAMGMAQSGQSVTVLDMAARSTMGLHFGLGPADRLPKFDAPSQENLVIHGVTLRDACAIAHSGDLADGLAAGEIGFDGDMLYIADIASADAALAERLRGHAALDLCVMAPSGECLIGLPEAFDCAGPNTAFALNKADDTRKLSRHAAVFTRELLGDRLLATVRADEAVAETAAMMQPLARHAPASAALHDINALGLAIAALAQTQRATSPVPFEAPRNASNAA